jgi:hypothetical protein
MASILMPVEFSTLQYQLGVKHLWACVKNDAGEDVYHEILLNGQMSIRYPRDNDTKEAFTCLEIRDDDNETVLAKMSYKEFMDQNNGDTYDMVNSPLPAFGQEYLHHSEIKRRCVAHQYNLFDPDYDETFFLSTSKSPFFQILGIPYLFVGESSSPHRSVLFPVHPKLVFMWRDIVNRKYYLYQLETLNKRIRQATQTSENNKRPRLEDF